MRTIRRIVSIFPIVTLLFLVGCSTLTPYEKEEGAVAKKVPPRVILPAETKPKAEGEKGLKEDSRISEDMTNQDYAGFRP